MPVWNNALFMRAVGRIRPRHRGERKWECAGSLALKSGGKASKAALPPLKTAVKLQVQVFLHSRRREACTCRFTTLWAGVKLRFDPTSFPRYLSFPFLLVGTWRTKPSEFSFSTPRTHHLSGTQPLAHPNGLHIEDAVESGRSRILLQLTGIISIRVYSGTAREIIGRSI